MGIVERNSVGLTFHGVELDPTEITRLLGCAPTKSEKKGDAILSRKLKIIRYAKQGYWSLEPDLPRSAEIEAKIVNILDKVTADLDIWSLINQKYSSRIFCGLFLDSSNEGFGLSPETLKQLADRGLKIEFDIYSKIETSKETEGAMESNLSVSENQAEQLENVLELLKAIASPTRLALLGVLAARLKEVLTLTELEELSKVPAHQLERDLRQLADVGFIYIEEWLVEKPGREPVPAKITFNQDFLKQLPLMISELHKLNSQLKPPAPKGPQDERSQVLARFMKDGKLVSWPAQLKNQLYIIEEVAKVFEAGVNYSEPEVNIILKKIYEYDYVTLRRYLVDLKFLQRANGIYRVVG